MRIPALLLFALLASGCAIRTCHQERKAMYWSDGTVTYWTMTVCQPKLRVVW